MIQERPQAVPYRIEIHRLGGFIKMHDVSRAIGDGRIYDYCWHPAQPAERETVYVDGAKYISKKGLATIAEEARAARCEKLAGKIDDFLLALREAN